MHKKSWFWLLVVVVMLMAAWWAYRCYDTYKYAPHINPHPKYFVTISGNIEPHMPYPQTLMFRATYGTYNPKCDVWISFIEGVKGSRGHPVYYPVHPNANGDYLVKIPIDAYKPGKCDWKAAWVTYTMVRKLPVRRKWGDELSYSDVIRFAHKNGKDGIAGYPNFSTATLYCGKGDSLHDCKGETIAGGYASIDVVRNKSYHFIQNIKNRRN